MTRAWSRTAGLVGGFAIVLAAIAGPAAAQAGSELVLENVDATSFPLVRAEVSGPPIDGELDDAFVVVENGEEVSADVVRLRRDGLNVVIALDVSGSMAGEPLDRAKAAIADTLATLPDTVPVALVSFGDVADLQSAFTTDREATMAAVDGLIAAGETALFDGLALSLAQLETQGDTGAVVVLADGADSASSTSEDQISARLSASGFETSFVALETPDFRAGTVEELADASGGRVLAVDEAAGLSDALVALAAGLSNFYEVRWRSSADGQTGAAEISLAGDSSQAITAEFEHDGPEAFVPDIATETRTVDGAGIFANSWIPLVAALFVTAGGLYLIVSMRNSEGAVERREERQSGRENRKEERKRRMSGVQDALEGFSAQMLEANNRGRSLDDRLDRAGLSIRSNEFVVACAAIFLASLLVGVLLFGIPFFLLGALIPAIGIPMTLGILEKRRRKKFTSQLGDTLQLMSGSLTAGYGLGQTLDSVSREAESPTAEEFARVVMETRLGRSLEDALDAMSLRIQSPDFDWVVDAIKIQASVGGDLAEILDQVGETIRARVRIKRQVDALAAEGKISGLVLFCLPFGLAGFIGTSNPGYVEPLFTTGTGYVLLGAALTMMAIGGLWLKKLVNPEF